MTYDLVSLSLCTSCPSSLGGLYVLLSAWILHGFNLKSILWIVWIHRKKTVSLPPSAAWHVLRPHELLLLQPVRLHLWSFHPKRMDSYLEYTKSKYFSLFWIGGLSVLLLWHHWGSLNVITISSKRSGSCIKSWCVKPVPYRLIMWHLWVATFSCQFWAMSGNAFLRWAIWSKRTRWHKYSTCIYIYMFLALMYIYILYIYPRIRKHVVYYVVYKLLFPGRPTWKSH